jgi:hypothetical protein
MHREIKIGFSDPKRKKLIAPRNRPGKALVRLLEKSSGNGLTKKFEFGKEKAFPKKIMG